MAQQMNLACFLLVLGFVTIGNANPVILINEPETTFYESVNFDDLFDKFLPIIQKTILETGMDPLDMPDFTETLIPLPGKLKRDIKFTEGWLQEMSRLSRAGPILIEYGEKVMNLDLNLHWDLLDFNYRYYFKLLFIPQDGDVYGRFNGLDANVKFVLDLENYHITLNSMKFHKIGKLDLKFEGQVGDSIRNAIAKVVTTIFPRTVLKIAEEASFKIFQMMMDDLNDQIPKPDRPLAFP